MLKLSKVIQINDNYFIKSFLLLLSLRYLDNTFRHANRIRFFTLGQNVRYLSEHSLDHLDYLTRFDLSKVILDQLYPTSKCILARYLKKQQKSNPSMIILPPQAEFCDCVYDFILSILNKKPEQSYRDLCQNTQQERCQLSECDVVKNFRPTLEEKKINQQIIPSIDESVNEPSISFHSQDNLAPTKPTTTIQSQLNHIPRHPPVYHSPQTHDDNNDDPIGSSFADTQVIIVDPIQLPSSSPRSYFVVRKRTRKGKKQFRKHFTQNNSPYSYHGPHW